MKAFDDKDAASVEHATHALSALEGRGAPVAGGHGSSRMPEGRGPYFLSQRREGAKKTFKFGVVEGKQENCYLPQR